MEERQRIARGLVTAHVIAFLISSAIGYTTNLVAGIISFALVLPPAAYLTPQLLDKLPYQT